MDQDASSREKVSIVVPCYNVGAYLARCLDSLLAQTFSDLEIICVNDGSTDNTLEVIRSYEQRFPTKFVVIDKQNEGAWQARLDGFAAARGSYIGTLDGDDRAEPDLVEKLYEAARSEDADLVICGFRRVADKSGKTTSTEMNQPRASFVAQEEPVRLLEINGAVWNKLFKAELLKASPQLATTPQIFEDMMLQLLIFPRVNKIAFVPSVLVNYTVREGSITTTIDKTKIASTYEAMREVKRTYVEGANAELNAFLDVAAFLHLGISLMFSISYDKTADLKRELALNRAFLNANFPQWDSDELLNRASARKYEGAVQRTYLARMVYRAHLMPAALRAYRLLIRTGHDIKW